ncbi:MAG: ornithine carbamoyltransferase [Planctomycetes bacterium]|nr:ornithine carbamoyltransferase [Planctomycetota bacterium]
MKHFISIAETSREDLDEIFQVSFRLRAERAAGKQNEPLLSRKTLAMIFEKPSLRTRVSFEQAMIELGGHAIVMGNAEVGLGKRELAADVGRVLSGMVQGIMARVFEHQKLLDLVEHSTVPVINALSEWSHPCQALADVMTMMDEFGKDLSGKTLAFIGDGNNVARSLAVICGRYDMKFVLGCPKGYELDAAFIDRLKKQAPGVDFRMTYDAAEAVRSADAVYTDTWISMGQEAEAEQRRIAFADHQVNAKLMAKAPKHAIVLHCLPAYRGYEISADLIDGPRSRIFPQAHNRLHAQKGLLAILMGGARGRREG